MGRNLEPRVPAAPAPLDRGRRARGPRDLRRHCPHPDPGARQRDEPPLARRRLLAPLADLRRAARAHRGADRPPGSNHGARFAWGHRDRGEPRCQAARTAATPRPSRGGRAARAPRTHAGLALVPVRALRRRLCVRDRRRPRPAGGSHPAARSRRARRLLARPHRRALPGGRAGRRHDGHRAGTAHDTRTRPPPAGAHQAPVPSRGPRPVAGVGGDPRDAVQRPRDQDHDAG